MPHVSRNARFGQILEMYQASTIREIIARMRTLSGEDLGDDPKPWIEKYCSRRIDQINEQWEANGRQVSGSETNQAPSAAGARR